MLYLVYFFFFVLLPYQGFCQTCGRCPQGFTYFAQESKCYRAFSTKQTWDEALNTCSQLGSHLVTITSALSRSPLIQIIAPIRESCMNSAVRRPAFWTAGRRKCSRGPFTWVPNRGIQVEMVYTNWLPGEPNNVNGNEDCVHFMADASNTLPWNDSPCARVDCFVCEVDI